MTLRWDALIKISLTFPPCPCHSKTHPPDLTKLSDEELLPEIVESKELLEKNLGKAIRYFTYPTGKNDLRVRKLVREAGYVAALAMSDRDENVCWIKEFVGYWTFWSVSFGRIG